eukprot:COSAG05_NODE_11459_length_512_cov_1.242131_1_plen_24_part_10
MVSIASRTKIAPLLVTKITYIKMD